MSASGVQQRLAEMRQAGIGVSTSNAYLVAVKAFLKWCVKDRRILDSAVDHVSPLNARVDVRRKRRALTTDELRRLIQATRNGEPWRGMSGPERAMLYRFAASTGLRWSELRSLTRASFDLDADPPTVAVEAAYSKRRRDDVLPLRRDTAVALKDFFGASQALPDASALSMPKGRVGAMMMRADLATARAAWIEEGQTPQEREECEKDGFLEFENATGTADFHALRHFFCTALARAGVAPKVAQDLARHSDINLTLSLYSHTVVADRAEALDALPDLDAPSSDALTATGTAGPAGLPSCLPEQERFPDRKCKEMQGRRGIATACSRGKEGAKTQDKPHVSAPLQVVEIAGLEPAASRVRF